MSGYHRVNRLSIRLLAAVGGLSLLIVYTPLANLLAMPLFSLPSNPSRADVIVVLSGGRNSDGTLNEGALERTITGVRLYRQGLAPRLLFSGGPCCGQSASSGMANLAAALGVPQPAILLEEQSLRTYESAVYCASLFRTNGIRSTILVTSPLHLLRAQLAFKTAGIAAQPVSASQKHLWLISDAAGRIRLLQESLHEYLGLAFYRIRAWI